MKGGYCDNQWVVSPHGYSIREGYDWLRMKLAKPDWYHLVWNKWNYPKHAMITWLAMNHGMNVKGRLFTFGCCADDRCCLCDQAVETQVHVFFNCVYSQQVMMRVERWCGFRIAVDDYACTGSGTGTRLKQKVHYLLWTACFYHLWCQRNNARINMVMARPDNLAMQIIGEVEWKIKMKRSTLLNRCELMWLEKWNCA